MRRNANAHKGENVLLLKKGHMERGGWTVEEVEELERKFEQGIYRGFSFGRGLWVRVIRDGSRKEK